MLLVSALILFAAIAAVIIARVRSRDELFAGVTPGQFPPANGPVETERISTGEYRGTIPVQFQPPRVDASGPVAPGLVGAVVEGRVRSTEVTATIVDLAVRGFLTITPLDEADGGRGKKDWLLTVNPEPTEQPREFELFLLRQLFGPGPRVRMSDLQAGFGMAIRQTQVMLYDQLVGHRWYRKHPRGNGGPSKGWGIAAIIAGVVVGFGLASASDAALRLLPGLAMIVAGIILLVGGRGIRVPRTAAGTAVRIQSLGFREYLLTAEADQIKFEEAADIFSRYLPYAIVFGVADRWAKLFGDIAKRHQMAEGLTNADMLDLMSDLMWIDFLTDGGVSEGIGELIGAFDPDTIGDMFGNVGDAFGDLGDAVSSGLGGLDFSGCDIGDLDLDGCGD